MPLMTAKVPWVTLGKDFPPTLNKVSDPAYLKPGESPAAYGINPDRPSFLSAGTCPSTGTLVAKTYTIGANTYSWWFNRLWRISTTQLIYGAPEYTAAYYEQGLGHMDFTEDANNLLVAIPVQNSLVLFKTTGAYIIGNADSQSGNFQRSNMIQQANIEAAGYAVGLNQLAYFCNSDGLFSIDASGQVVEITAPVRTSISPFSEKALGADYAKGYVIGATSQFCYDTLYKKLFDYSTSGFLYTSPTLRMSARGYENNPFVVDAVAFEIYHADSSDGQLTMNTRCGDRDWSDDITVELPATDDALTRVMVQLDSPQNARTFAMRITALSSNVYIKSITASVQDFTMESYAE